MIVKVRSLGDLGGLRVAVRLDERVSRSFVLGRFSPLRAVCVTFHALVPFN
jgi:hypothetical protein